MHSRELWLGLVGCACALLLGCGDSADDGAGHGSGTDEEGASGAPVIGGDGDGDGAGDGDGDGHGAVDAGTDAATGPACDFDPFSSCIASDCVDPQIKSDECVEACNEAAGTKEVAYGPCQIGCYDEVEPCHRDCDVPCTDCIVEQNDCITGCVFGVEEDCFDLCTEELAECWGITVEQVEQHWENG